MVHQRIGHGKMLTTKNTIPVVTEQELEAVVKIRFYKPSVCKLPGEGRKPCHCRCVMLHAGFSAVGVSACRG
jgi:hypothetical protein